MKTNSNDPISWEIVQLGITTDGVEKACLPGLTKREYFAAMAMQAFISSGSRTALIDNQEMTLFQASVHCSQALIKALNAEEK